MKTLNILFLTLLSAVSALAQTKIGGAPGAANANAYLELGDPAGGKGFLISRVPLTSTTAAAPLGAHVAGMTVYNTATAGTAPNNVTPGYYYSDGTKWVRLISSGDPGAWGLTGNAGTSPANHFLGTTDNAPLRIKINNTNAGTVSTGNTALGYQSQLAMTTGVENTALGVSALSSLTTSFDNTAIGYNTLNKSVTMSGNTAIGAQVISVGTGGTGGAGGRNTGVGYLAMIGTNGNYNSAFGTSALHDNTSGNYNLALGANAGYTSTTGSNNILIGSNSSTADSPNTSAVNASNELNIGNTLFGTGVNNTIASATGKIGINTNAPTSTLTVKGTTLVDNGTTAGALQIKDGTQGSGKVLTSDANGVGTWKTPVTATALSFTPSSLLMNYNDFVYTGESVTLPPGKWMIDVKLGVSIPVSPAYTTTQSVFRVRLCDAASGVVAGAFSADVYVSSLATVHVPANLESAILVGSLGINNTSGSSKTYYLWADGLNSTYDPGAQIEVKMNIFKESSIIIYSVQ